MRSAGAVLVLACLAASPALAQQRGSANADLDAGFRALEQGDYDTSIQLTTRAIDSGQLRGRNLAIAHANRCSGYIRKSQLALAKIDCDRAISVDASLGIAYLNRGVVQGRQGQREAAIADNKKAVELLTAENKPGVSQVTVRNLAVALSNRCIYAQQDNRAADAMADCNAALRFDPANGSALRSRAGLHFAAERYADAIADLDKAVGIDPRNGGAYGTRGAAQHNLGHYDKAVADYGKWIELEPGNRAAYIHRGDSYRSLRQYQRAVADYGKAIELDAADGAVFMSRGRGLLQLGRVEEADADFARASELKPNDPALHFARAQALREAGHVERALPHYDRAISLKPDSADYYLNRGFAHRLLRRHETALVDFDRAQQLDAKSYWPQYYRIDGLLELDRAGEALAEAQRLVVRLPGEPNALRRRADVELALGRHDAAIATNTEGARLRPNWSTFYTGRGYAHAARGDFAPAALDLRRAESIAQTALAAADLFVFRERAGEKGWGDLAKAVARIASSEWPAPILTYLLGNMSLEQLAAAAKHDDPGTEAQRLCLADYYAGQAALIKNERAPAAERLAAVAARCPKYQLTTIQAAADAKRLGAK